ncbi:hypothetical protein ACQ4PT_020344 [Festuca glaucescens]
MATSSRVSDLISMLNPLKRLYSSPTRVASFPMTVLKAPVAALTRAASMVLGGKRVGIIGLGSIGSSIAKRLKALGRVIQYHSRRPKDTVSFKYFHDVISLATESDALIVACALNDQTRHIVNKEVLGALGKDGVVVNIARGGNIDEAELISALREGKIAGAGLDVFEKEPVVPAEFFSMDNVVLTGHEAVFTTESGSDLCDLMIGNLEAFFDGRPLLTPVLPK